MKRMRRKDREMDADFARDVLARCEFATLAMVLEDDMPYCIPISPALIGNSIYFHSAKHGQKTDTMRANPKVCVSAVCDAAPQPEEFAMRYSSAIAFGRACEVNDDNEKMQVLRAISEKYAASNMGAFDDEIAKDLKRTAVWRIDIDEITGKHKG